MVLKDLIWMHIIKHVKKFRNRKSLKEKSNYDRNIMINSIIKFKKDSKILQVLKIFSIIFGIKKEVFLKPSN